VSRAPRILVIEDDQSIRDALHVKLLGEGYEVRTQADGLDASTVAQEFWPDLAVLDVRLPRGPDGYALARLLRQVRELGVVFLTAADGVAARLAGFDAGADDYLVKPFVMEELLARIRALLRRVDLVDDQRWEVGDLVVDEACHTVTRGGHPLDLTHLEYTLLTFLVRHPDRVLSKSYLLAKVWGYEAYDGNLVEVQVSALRRKLELHGPRLLHTVRGAGYVLRR